MIATIYDLCNTILARVISSIIGNHELRILVRNADTALNLDTRLKAAAYAEEIHNII